MESGARKKVFFTSAGSRCAAWHYPGSNRACVVMAAGLGITKEPGTDRFAQRFNEAGFTVLAFDYRRLGESAGEPRQVVRVRDQLADWHVAIGCARGLPEVDPARVALWGFSVSGGYVLEVAARDARVAAAIAQTPNVDGPAATRNAMRYQTVPGALRLTGTALADALGGLLGRPPRLVPLGGRRGELAVLTTPEATQTDEALDPDGRYAGWPHTVAARSTLAVGGYRPGALASRIGCPLLVVVADDDRSALAAPAVRAAARAARGELLRVPGGHYAPFQQAHDVVVASELKFLGRHLQDEVTARTPRAS